MSHVARYLSGHWRGLVLPLAFLAAWQWASGRGDVSAYAFVPLQNVWNSFIEIVRSGDLLINLKVSLLRTCIGLSLGVFIGLVAGSLMALFRLIDRLVGPLYQMLRQVPILGLIPLIGLWFGNGETAKLLLIALAAFYPMVLNTYEGLKQVERRYVEVAEMLTLNRRQTFLKVLLPSAMPDIFTGISHALAFAWLSSIGAELLLTAGPGIGALLVLGEVGGRLDIVIVCVVIIALIGYAMNSGTRLLGQYLTRWKHA